MPSHDDVQTGADRIAIQDLMARYAWAVDAKRYELLDDVFLAGAEIDFVANGGIKDSWPAIGAWCMTTSAKATRRLLRVRNL